jgi:branched-chain amino acid transport system permease protein
MLAIWLRYNGPDTSLSFEIMMDVLLIVVIGGMGTIYGAAMGSADFRDRAKLPAGSAQAWAAKASSSIPWLAALAVA